MTKTDEELRENIKISLINCRQGRELTQTEVGKLVGKSKNAVASWEQGLSLPDVTTLFKLSKLYKKPVDWFYKRGD